MTKQEDAAKLQEAIEVALCTGWTTIHIRVGLLCKEGQNEEN